MGSVRNLGVVALCVAPLLYVGPAAAQQQDQTIYTYVADYRVAAAKRADFVFQFNQYAKPVLDRLVADGTLVEWGRTTPVIHTEDGMTDGVWWCATSVSGGLKVIDEVGKTGMPPSIADSHRDSLLQSLVFRTGKNTATGGFIYISAWNLKPGKGEAWMDFFNKYRRPVYEKLLADGAILGYGIDIEYVHTASPLTRSVWVQTPDAASVDKVDAAYAAARQAMSAQERGAMTASMEEALAEDSHRDFFYRVVEYRHR